jgi:hypothetical protein
MILSLVRSTSSWKSAKICVIRVIRVLKLHRTAVLATAKMQVSVAHAKNLFQPTFCHEYQ